MANQSCPSILSVGSFSLQKMRVKSFTVRSSALQRHRWQGVAAVCKFPFFEVWDPDWRYSASILRDISLSSSSLMHIRQPLFKGVYYKGVCATLKQQGKPKIWHASQKTKFTVSLKYQIAVGLKENKSGQVKNV